MRSSCLNLILRSVMVFTFLSSVSALAAPDQAFDRPQVVAVEPRAFNPKYDVTANLGVLPMDAFYKGLSYGVSYTNSYSSLWSWEIVNLALISKMDTNLKKDLLNNFQVRPQQQENILDSLSWYALTSAVYTPIYAKNLLFNKKLVYGSMSFVASAGMTGFSSSDTAPMFGGGVIIRVFHSPKYSSKFDARYYMHMADGKSSDMVMMLTYGFSFELGDNKPMEK